MNNFEYIQTKLHHFSRKYYVNELIKGLLLFFSFGLLYFIFTLLIEYFLWLKPLARTILFLCFIVVETALFVFYILIPIFKIWGLKKGINEVEASKIIGNHFPEVKDKLLNMLQLKNIQQNSELIEASIEQKSNDLKPIPFKNAVNFSTNKKYVKYVFIPVVIWLLFFITGNSSNFNNSFSRVVHYQTQYEPPAPFSFKVLNNSLNVVEGEPFTLQIETVGNTVPEDAKIYFLNENYYLENVGLGKFQYTFSSVKESFNFYMEAGEVVSNEYMLKSIATPVINNLKMVLNYPDYTGKKNEVVQNTGNAIVPQGTTVTWQIETHQTDYITFNTLNKKSINFVKNSKDYFSYASQILETTNYSIATSNKQLKNHEHLNFTVQVIPDEFPKIIVNSDIDSITNGPVQFIGQLSDDYTVNKLQLIYYNKKAPNELKTHNINILKSSLTDFYYVYPDGISIEEGVEYEFYFEVSDNDAIHGGKKTKSKKFSYYNKTEDELKNALLKEQKETMSAISKSLQKSKESDSELEKFKNNLQEKANVNWNDTKKLEAFIKRQNQYQEMFQKQTNALEQNLKEQPVTEDLKEQKEELQKRIEETKKLNEQQKMLDELNKLSEKLEKEDLIEKLQDIAKKNKQNSQSLERILELTKRFYVEQKATQISEQLEKLAQKQETLSKENDADNTSEKQNEISEKFEEIKKDFNELDKQNKDLMRPMKLPENSNDKKEIDENLLKALEELVKSEETKSPESNKSEAKQNQKTAAKKMKKMSKSMEQSMAAMEGESIDENIDDLRKIVENLIEFSFQQEDLMVAFNNGSTDQLEYPKNLKKQYLLKEYFEHIDDSLYVLSLRLVKMGTAIQKEVYNANSNIDAALSNFSENNFEQGIANQHFVIMSANELANQLSDLLESLMNASASMGNGKGGKPEFGLPDIIQKQDVLGEKMKQGLKESEEGNKQGKKPGENGEVESEQMNGELFEIYKQQEALREALKELMQNQSGSEKEGTGKAINKMEELENTLLEKGFSKEVIEKMQQLNYELLKLEKATLEQGEDDKRTSETNIQTFEKRTIDTLKLQNRYFKNSEILNRQSLPLRTIYKKKVQEYFKTED